MTLLAVNVDHVATLRQARGTDYPDPVDAARIAESAGASGITVHLRADRRHIQDRDVVELRSTVRGKLNLEMAATDEMVDIALRIRPDQATLVPERPDEVTTEGGLDLATVGERCLAVAEQLTGAGISVSAFIDPELPQVNWLADRGPSPIRGFEINTDRYARAAAGERMSELAKIRKAAGAGATAGLRVYAGHALTTDNVADIVAVSQIEELNIGHFLVCRAVLVGMATAVREMLDAMSASRDA